jgi:PhnB protein
MSETPDPTVTFSLTVKDTSRALAFYKEAFGAEELFRMPSPDGGVAHAEFMIGNTRVYISDEYEDYHAFAMPEGTTASCLFSILVEDCDAAHERAAACGAATLSAPEDRFWGTRSSVLRNPFGYRWSLNQRIEELTQEKIERRARELYAS